MQSQYKLSGGDHAYHHLYRINALYTALCAKCFEIHHMDLCEGCPAINRRPDIIEVN